MKRHKGLVRAAQDELASIHSAPRGRPPAVSLEEEARHALTVAQELLDSYAQERRDVVRSITSRPRRAS